jgi:hypothetical protein
LARVVAVALIAVLLAFQVVRTAVVRQAPLGTPLWPGHPEIVRNQIMAEIGKIAALGDTIPPRLLPRVEQVAREMPLAPEPFLIHGALAQIEGRDAKAERLYLEARSREPRSPAARYFLTERYLRTGRVQQALAEMAVLSRLTGAVGVFAPALASYAQTPGAVPHLRRFFAMAPEFEPVVLSALASDTKNLSLINLLWSGTRPSTAVGQPDWQAQIVTRLVEAQDFNRAHDAWRRFTGIAGPVPGLFNPGFARIDAPPPFNWTFGSAGGLAQPTGNGELELIYFGQDEAVLAQQLLMLAPGRYVIRMKVSGDVKPGSGIAWSIDCTTGRRSLLTLPVVRQPSRKLQAVFAVPPGCPAQQLRLIGSPGEFARAIEFTVGQLQLTRLAPGPAGRR